MNYNVRGENIAVTPALREYAEKKIGKLERYFADNPKANANINLKVYQDKTSKVEVTIPLKNLVLRAEEHTNDMYAAIDLISEKLERQIRKHKTKLNRKFRERGHERIFMPMAEVEEAGVAVQEEEELELVRVKRFDLKPMDSEEAILQMNLLGHNFYVYSDAETDETHIVYKRKDNKYGLIQVN